MRVMILAAMLFWIGPADSLAQRVVSGPTACSDPLWSRLQPPAFVPASAPQPGPYERLMPYQTGLSLGVGFLRSYGGGPVSEWYRHVRLPLFRGPGQPGHDEPFGWIVDGWLVELADASVRPFGTSGLVETDYESSSAIVYEVRSTGWIRFRYLPEEEGTAWTHECFFDLGDDPVSVTTWQERLTSAVISPIFFRDEGPHALRAQPGADAERLASVPADPAEYHLEPLEIRGDWMRVTVVQPSDYCAAPAGVVTRRSEGWVRWRDDEIGPWLWYYTRGC